MKKIVLLIITVLVIISLGACGGTGTTVKRPVEPPRPAPTAEPTDDPDMPYFMTDLGAERNSDGTYTFYGEVTGGDYTSVDIKSLTGGSYSTGDDYIVFQAIYQRSDGTYGSVRGDAADKPYYLSDAVFEITYNSDGELVGFKQVR